MEPGRKAHCWGEAQGALGSLLTMSRTASAPPSPVPVPNHSTLEPRDRMTGRRLWKWQSPNQEALWILASPFADLGSLHFMSLALCYWEVVNDVRPGSGHLSVCPSQRPQYLHLLMTSGRNRLGAAVSPAWPTRVRASPSSTVTGSEEAMPRWSHRGATRVLVGWSPDCWHTNVTTGAQGEPEGRPEAGSHPRMPGAPGPTHA